MPQVEVIFLCPDLHCLLGLHVFQGFPPPPSSNESSGKSTMTDSMSSPHQHQELLSVA
jgi:hypothetical protein